VMFAWQNTPETSLAMPGLTGEALAPSLAIAKFDLTLSLAEAGEGIEGGMEYATALLDQTTVERWIGHWRTLLTELVEVSDATSTGRLPLLSAAERRQVLVDWNATEADDPKDQCIHQLVEAQAERTPEAKALVFEEQSLSYAELNDRANRLAHYLIGLGIRPDDRVAIGVERSVEMVVGVLAILKAGGAYVPLDPAYPQERLAFMLQDSASLTLLMHGATRERLAALAGDVTTIDLDADAAAWAEQSVANPEPAALGLWPNHLAYMIYTSGTTGKPKGVMVEHRGIVGYLAWTAESYGEASGLALVHSPLAFDLTVTGLFTPLVVGGCVRIASLENAPLGEIYTFVKSTPSHLPLLAARADELSFTATAEFLFGGEALWGEALAPWRERHPQATLLNVYGPTEATVNCCEYRIESSHPIPSGRVPIGKPQANTRLYVLNSALQPLPVNVQGDLYIAGAGLARGYCQRPGLSAECFVADPYGDCFGEPGSRMYRTGDLARWLPDGNLEYLGRADFQVKIRGFRIELGEIEAALRSGDGSRDAVVLAREEVPGDKRLVAYVIPDPALIPAEVDALPSRLKAHLQSSLPDYMLPAAFVVLESFPLTPNGKLDRKALPAPEADAYATSAYEPPEGAVEETLAALWSELLRIERVGRHDDFFALGGHSLLALRLLSELQQTFGVRLPVGAVFLRPTLAGLAEAVGDSRLAEEAAALVPLQPEGQELPLFLLPGAIGSVLYLQPLAAALGRDRPVLALPSPGLDGRPPLASVPALAAHHLRAMRRQQPQGPYLLAGHSSGGRVAYELARQLEEQGESVACLVILDTNAPDAGQDRSERSGRELLAEVVAVFEEFAGVALGLSREELLAEPEEAVALARVMAAFQANGVLFSKGAAVAELQALVEVYRAALGAQDGYRIEGRIRAPIHLLKARERGGADGFEDIRPAWGWQACSEEGAIVAEVPGTHITMMVAPQVAVLAERLGGILAAADVSTDPSASAALVAVPAEAGSRR
jgi:amino acid adenylation domain-containing protein